MAMVVVFTQRATLFLRTGVVSRAYLVAYYCYLLSMIHTFVFLTRINGPARGEKVKATP